ncbi:MAG: diguanylate cyclase [Sphingomonas bacterium]
MILAQTLWRTVFPPIPEAILGDFKLLRASRLQSQIPLLYLTLLLTIPTTIYGSSQGAPAWVRVGIPVVMGTACLARFLTWMKKRKQVLDVQGAAKMITAATWVSGTLGTICSTWCVISFLTAPTDLRIYYPMIMSMGSLATAYCLSTIRGATIINLLIGLLPISLLLLFSGNRMDLAAGTSLVVASAFLLRMIFQQHDQLVDLLLLQRQMRELADTDPLTGLPNRRVLAERLDEQIARAGPNASFALALLDLDGFKPVNDQYGHGCGDFLLCEVADRLREACGPHALPARLGGDEFAILVPAGSAISLATVADHMLAALVPPYRIEGHVIRVGASIGVATWPGDGATSRDLFEIADAALYAVKAQRNERCSPGGNEAPTERVQAA